MTDGPSAIDAAAKAATGVATDAAAGNVWAFGVFVAILAAALIGLWIWRSTTHRPRPDHDDDPEPTCEPAAKGCPAIQSLVAQVDMLARQIEADREERRQHRGEVNSIVSEVHRRIDQLVLAKAG